MCFVFLQHPRGHSDFTNKHWCIKFDLFSKAIKLDFIILIPDKIILAGAHALRTSNLDKKGGIKEEHSHSMRFTVTN